MIIGSNEALYTCKKNPSNVIVVTKEKRKKPQPLKENLPLWILTLIEILVTNAMKPS